MLATVIGYVIVAVVAFWLLGAVIGTLRFVVRAVVTLLIIGGLVTLWARLKAPSGR